MSHNTLNAQHTKVFAFEHNAIKVHEHHHITNEIDDVFIRLKVLLDI